MKKIAYQGEPHCYTHQVINKFLNSYDTISCKSFDNVFSKLINKEVEFILIPIENSSGGSLYINYDLFYEHNIKHNINIVAEYTYQIKHCLYTKKGIKLDDISCVLSHPQALLQCKDNIKKRGWNSIESWDTTGSISDMLQQDDNYACIAPPKMEKYNSDITPHIKNFNDQQINITRFYLISMNNTVNHKFTIKDTVKFSSYLVVKDQIGVLNEYLTIFANHKINLTKIESRPSNEKTFSYIFFIEGIGNYSDISIIRHKHSALTILGIFPVKMDKIKISLKPIKSRIGIVGFGRFGQFIGKELVNSGFNVICTSRNDYNDIANNMGISYYPFEQFVKKKVDIVILATSILSFEEVIKRFDKKYWKNKIVTDVLSVKEYPFNLLNKYIDNNILLTHPMFGPDSAKLTWQDKKFVYWIDKIDHKLNDKLGEYLDFWKDKGCNMIRLHPVEHDKLAANSQFITHFIGRTLANINTNTDLSTDGFNALIKIRDHTIHDSWDLFNALAKYNKHSKKSIQELLFVMNNLFDKLYPRISIESPTSILFSKIHELQKTREIINCAVGVPSWKPNTNLLCEYSPTKGRSELLDELIKYYGKFDINISSDNIVITGGAKPSLYMSIYTLTKPGTSWIIPKPYWVSYGDMIKRCGGEPIYVESAFENNWEADILDIEEKLNNKLVNGIIICNPNNPTGLVYSDEWIQKLNLLCKKYSKYVIADEVYIPLTNLKSTYNGYEKQIIVNSFSKGWGMPGFRVGWVIANPNLIKEITKFQSSTYTCAPTVSQELAIKVLKENYKPDLSILVKCKNELADILISKGWSLVKNNYTSLYLFPYKKGVDLESTINSLLEAGCAVMNGNAFGINYAMRITLWNNQDKLDKIKDIFNKVL